MCVLSSGVQRAGQNGVIESMNRIIIAVWLGIPMLFGCNEISKIDDLYIEGTDSSIGTGFGVDTATHFETTFEAETGTIFDTSIDTEFGTGTDSVSICGDGIIGGLEGCEDGNSVLTDGCANCMVSFGYSCEFKDGVSTCMIVPDAPIIEGEVSCGHNNPTWLWNRPEHTFYLEYRLNAGQWVATQDDQFTGSELSGAVKFDIRACNQVDGCSAVTQFTTTIESFGMSYPGVWQGVKKNNLTTSPLGNVVPVSCHNCYNGPDNQGYQLVESLAKINLAVSRDADLIELDIVIAGTDMCVTHGDVDACGLLPTLPEILADTTFANSDALLFIEIKENASPAQEFATSLLDILNANRAFVKNGRPVFVRAFSSRLSYLEELRNQLSNYPLIAKYFKFAVLYDALETSDIAAFQATIKTEVADAGYDMIEVGYASKNLLGFLTYAQSLGLAVGLWTIPNSFGEAYLSALRDEVDELTTEYRVDMAREVIEDTNILAYVNTWGCVSEADTAVSVYRNNDGTLVETKVPINAAPVTTLYGTPGLVFNDVGQDSYACSLDFRDSVGFTERALPLGVTNNDLGGGFLVTAFVHFGDLSLIPEQTMGIVQNSQTGGYTLELARDSATNEVIIRFGVYVDGGYKYHQYNVDATGLGGVNESLNDTDSYFLLGAYDGNSGLSLWIDFKRNGSGGSYSTGVTQSSLPSLGGADPQPSGLQSRFHFNGLIQQVQVQRWNNHNSSEGN